MTPEQFRTETGVSRETLDRLSTYAELLAKWQKSINLVGASTLDDLWRRHFFDSAQLAGLAQGDVWLDLGSGAGFPGMVLALMGVGRVHLVESDQRKCAFLTEVAARTGAAATIHPVRIEALTLAAIGGRPAAVVTARALAALPRLLDWTAPFLGSSSNILFHQGAHDVDAALTESRKSWRIDADKIPSRTQPDSVILRIKGLLHADRDRSNGT